jgi:hypothetical protein
MELTAWSIDDVVRTSDDAAVRRRFAHRNRVWLIILMIVFQFAALIQFANHGRNTTPASVLIAAANFGFVALSLFLIRYTGRDVAPSPSITWRIGLWLRRNISAAALTFVVVEYVFMILNARNADGWVGWAISIPMLVIGFRMQVAEQILLHAILLGGGLITAFVKPFPRGDATPILVSLTVVNLCCLAIELFASRRMRRMITGEWTIRRASAREQVRMRDELRYAREMQLSMLPECAPDVPWADICSISLPATEVGGDYYDYFVDGDRVALVCGDVAGHGMASGLVLSALRSGFTLLRDSLGDPAAVLRRLHVLVAETSRRRMLVTVSVVLLDWRARRAIISSAGHPPVIHRRADGTVETIDLFAPPLGVRLPVDIPQRHLDIAPGDVFVLHSDGIYETRNAAGEDYGLDRVVEVVRQHGGGNAESIRSAILADVDAFRAGVEQDDDVTLVVCRLT